jgi:hypothetical protein
MHSVTIIYSVQDLYYGEVRHKAIAACDMISYDDDRMKARC